MRLCGRDRLGKTLEPANQFGVLLAKVFCYGADGDRWDAQSLSYSEFASSLQRQSMTSASTGAGIPAIFKFDGAFTNAVATAESSRSVRVYFQASQVISKARVNIEEEDISLDPTLVGKIRGAVGRKAPEELLDVLRDYGQFVATTLILGGRITLHTSTELDNKLTFEAVERTFKTAADARFSVDGIPVEAGGGVGNGTWERANTSTIQQAKSLKMELKGGTEALELSQPGALGTQWVDSVGPFIRWRIIGFGQNSLVPITDFLDQDLKKACLALLRTYFISKLRVARTGMAGDPNNDIYGPDNATLRRVKRISEIVVDHGENVDGIKWIYELYPGPRSDKPETGYAGYENNNGIGAWRGEKDKLATIRLDEDEWVVAIKAGCDPNGGMMRRLAIRTNKGTYPDDGFFGRNKSANEVKEIQAPRVIGFHGFKGALVHCMGLCYLRLGDDTHSPDFLEKIAPLLFPKRDYGPIGTP